VTDSDPDGGQASTVWLWQAFDVVGVGARIAAYRRRRGLSQVTLAGLVGRSESWLSQVERGLREVDSLHVISALAAALKVSARTLIGFELATQSADPGHLATDPIRRFLDGYRQLLTAPQVATSSAAELLARADALNEDYQAARYDQALSTSPGLLAAADALLHTNADASAIHAYVAAYVVTAKILHKVGESRLAGLAADRAATAASRPDTSAVDHGLAAREVVSSLLFIGQPLAAEALAVDMAARLEADADSDSDEVVSLRGSLLLLAAVIAAQRTERYEALDRLAQAERLATRLGHDGNHCWTAFGPTNVAIHGVSIAAELGDAGEAVRLSRQVDPTRLPVGLTSRRAQLHLDLAWAYTQQRRDPDAILQLLEAERIAPQLIQFHPQVREALSDLVGRGRGTSGVLHDLATRAGILIA
jgi:transcriptional regulator with XRE-family HTH domain